MLAEVYLELIGGRQPDFALSVTTETVGAVTTEVWWPKPRPTRLAPRLTAEEAEAHQALIAGLGDTAIWKRFG